MMWKRSEKAPEREFTEEEAREIGKSINADFDKHDFKQFHMGLPVEWEHKDTVDGDLPTIGNIVLDHLEEYPDYYDRLKKVESSWRPWKPNLVKLMTEPSVLERKTATVWHDVDGALHSEKLGKYIESHGPQEAAGELLRYYRTVLGYDAPKAVDRASRDLFWAGIDYQQSLPLLQGLAANLDTTAPTQGMPPREGWHAS